ncbi:Negative regulator of mitotic exit [Pleurotus ostreatus]|uniref:Negative regulator of mitotic exit n=1 Tax=Pleurotus ostreatus TaxID=5322 RepID=A0A8H6ZNN0_PLEOS|nr:Negative regulator of mitotic exit [Pleurotus ostreatus]KAF7422223.1 Negative regulator of mitotic exit [Pleurotus ostreatus]
MSFISNLFPRFFGKNPTPTSLDLAHEQTPAPYPWSTHPLQLLPPTVSTNTSRPGPACSPTPPSPLSASPESPESPSPFPRYGHSVAASHGDLYLFGGLVDGRLRNDVYLLRAAFAESNGGNSSDGTDTLSISASLFETGVSHEWTRATVHGPAPSARYGHAAASIGASFFVFGGHATGAFFNDIWVFTLTTLAWELCEPVAGDRPAPRSGHSCVAHGDNVIVFGGTDGTYHYHDTWAFDTRSRTWTALPCTGYIPAPRAGHASSLVGDVIYWRYWRVDVEVWKDEEGRRRDEGRSFDLTQRLGIEHAYPAY